MSSAMRRLLIVPLLLVLIVSVVGCGRKRAAPTPESVTLRFAFRKNIADYETLAGEFHRQYPNITVELVPIDPFRGGGVKTIDGMQIDVVRWNQDYLTPERQEQVLPLDEIISADTRFPRQDIFQEAMTALQRRGAQLGIPAGIDFLVAYYNVRRFQTVGATPPTPDWTLDDFLAAAVAVHNTQGASTQADFTYGFCSEPDSGDPIFFTYMFGGRLVDDLLEPNYPTLDDPANIEAVQWYANLRTEYGVIPAPDELRRYFPRGRKFEAIVRGKCGLWLGLYSDRNGRAWGFAWQDESAMLPLPRGRVPFQLAQTDGYYILSQTQHPQEAWTWIRFLLDHQEAAGQMAPPLRSQVLAPEYSNRVGEDVAEIARSLASSTDVIFIPGEPDPILEKLFDLYNDAVLQVINGEMRAEAALNAAQVQAEALFAERQ